MKQGSFWLDQGNKQLKENDLSEEQAKNELEMLAKQIKHHNQLYYQQSQPEITDAEYDQLVLRNQALESKFPHLIREDSPSTSVGSAPIADFPKFQHLKPMLSLANIFSIEDADDFLNKIHKRLLSDTERTIEQEIQTKLDKGISLVAEPKIDGVSFTAIFKKGVLAVAATRGDGSVGEEITANVKTLINFPHYLKTDQLHYPDLLEVRGEIYIDHPNFIRINQEREKEGLPLFANPRNAASGSLRQLDREVTKKRQLKYFVYAIGEVSQQFAETQMQCLSKLKQLGFVVNDRIRLCDNLEQLMAYYQEIFTGRAGLDYDIDGTVYKVNSFQLQDRLGFIARSPRWAVAHKFPAEQAKTMIHKITIQVGRTGALTPVAELIPINVGGVVVSRASLHNREEIQRKDIREGDVVVIQRAGDVIPQIVEVDLSQRQLTSSIYIFPDRCPACQSLAIQEEGEAVTRCINSLNCPDQITEKLTHFVSRNAFNIEGLGERQINAFYQAGLITSVIDIFTLEERNKSLPTPISKLPNWGEKSATNLFAAISQAKVITFEKFIFSLGIRHIGETTALLLAQHYQNITRFINQMVAVSQYVEIREELISINGIGEKVTQSLAEFFSLKDNIDLVTKLAEILEIKETVTKVSDHFLAGKTIVFTGSLNRIGRSEAKDLAQSFGASVSSSVSSKTDLVVSGLDAGSKLKKAQELGVNIISEDQWFELINKTP